MAPPSAQCLMWCASHQDRGLPHPGKEHPPSRSTRALRIPEGTTGVLRPTSSGSEVPMVMMRETPASHARRRAVSGVIGPTSWSSARLPGMPWRLCRSTVTTTWGRSPATWGLSERSRELLQSSTRASARRWGADLGSRDPSLAQGSWMAPSAVMRICPDSGSKDPSMRTVPWVVGETWRWRPSHCRLVRSSAPAASAAWHH